MDKKKLLKIVALIVGIVVLYFLGSKLYMAKFYNYKQDVKNALDLYYTSLNVNDLEPIPELFKKYGGNETRKKEIQAYSKDLVVEWFDFLSSKYVCDVENVNACKLQADELSDLIPKIDKLYNYRDIDGYRIIDVNSYQMIKTNITDKISSIQEIISNNNAKRPLNEDEAREQKCNVTSECESCRDGICTCTYTGSDGTKESILCKKDGVS